VTDTIQDFARKHDLVLEQSTLLGKVSKHIQGRNGFVMVTGRPDRLLVGIIYLTGWERLKLEFQLAYQHIRVVPERCSHDSLCAEFSPADEGQARLIVKLAQLKPPQHDDQTLSHRRISRANLLVASILRRVAEALRDLER
jgi:hypothetical protein